MDSLSNYNYDLPQQLIAQKPAENRSDSRLLVIRGNTQQIHHRQFFQMIDYLNPGDALVVNTSKVMKARLIGKKYKSGGKVEVLLSRFLEGNKWVCLVRSKGEKNGQLLDFSGHKATILGLAPKDDGAFVVEFENLEKIIDKCGQLPLPPYIERCSSDEDFSRYQTVYADDSQTQSVASPTAGLHFDEVLLEKIKEKGVKVVPIVLHVGPGTFLPVRHEDLSLHQMHAELACISENSARVINETKNAGHRVIAVGTTAVRTLESAADELGKVKAGEQLTRLFIKPGFRFKIVDAMITNFHLPKTTLLMLVSAFAGRKRILEAYEEAIKEKYRFFSYGDASYIEREENHESI